jgi:hypothetical protein
LVLPEIKVETDPISSFANKGKRPISIPALIDIPSVPETKFPASQSFEEYILHSDSTLVGSLVYISCKFEEPSPHLSFPPFSDFLSPDDQFPEPLSLHPKVVGRSLHIFENPLYNLQVSSPILSMVVVRGDGVGGGGGFGVGGGGGSQGPPPPPIIFTKVFARYSPLVLPVPLHDLPENYMKNLPKFTGEGDLTTTEHIKIFNQFVDILGLEHEDVYSRLLVQNFEGQMRTSFQGLPAGSIRTYDELENAFLGQWGERKDNLYYLTEFRALRKKNLETVLEFTQRFNKLYNKILVEVKPSQPAAKVTLAGAFEPDFALLLREMRSTDLTRMQDDAIEIESNMMASGKLKAKVETRNKETRQFREQARPSGSRRSAEDKMDDMEKIIKELSNKILRMELDQSKTDHFTRKYFRRNPNPQTQQRHIKNEDQKIHTPFKNENFIGGDDMQNFEDLEEDMNNLSDQEPHLTRQDYQRSLGTEYLFNDDNINIIEDFAYQGIVDNIMVELQQKYNLRPRDRNVTNSQPKKILTRSKASEAAQSAVETQTVKTKAVETQTSKTKSVEILTVKTKTVETKATQTNKSEKRKIEIPTGEAEKTTGSFNLENEINKIKILTPPVELCNAPGHQPHGQANATTRNNTSLTHYAF